MAVSVKNHHRIDYIELPVQEVADAKQFYGTVFGWKFQDWGEEYASFEDGRLGGGLHGGLRGGAVGPLVILYSSDLEATRDTVIAAGGKLTKEIFAFPGGRRFHFADPSGNVLAVWSDIGVEPVAPPT